jgi:hypothetical protein
MLTLILLVLSLVCFILAAANNVGQPVQFGWLGLAFWVLTLLIARGA